MIKIFASLHLGPRCGQWSPCPHQGRLFIVCTPGLQPGPPDKGRAVIYSGRCALLGVVGESGGGARPLRGTDHSAGPRRGVLEVGHSRPPGFDQGASGPKKASRIWAPGLGFLPSPPPTHCVCRERRGGGGQGHPSSCRECARPRGARGAGAARACGGGRVCGPVFGQLSTLGEKNICLKVQKKKKGGGRAVGGLKKIVKPKLERVFAK